MAAWRLCDDGAHDADERFYRQQTDARNLA
jgi:hypothetical protein